jgi:hypothetical protein
MGFFDSIKKKLGGPAAAPPPPQAAPPPPEAPVQAQAPAQAHAPVLDLAGFDPMNDEEGFFNAILHMESEGQYGGTDASRAEICARYGIRDRSHWQDVKAAVYHVLVQKHGSIEVVSQLESNWRMGQMQRQMQQNVVQQAAGGGFAPVEGVTLEAWAATNAAIIGGANIDDLLKGAGIDRARWDRVSAEWNARMARDTTFAVATVYGNAFQAASQGKYNAYAKEANAARAANRDLSMQPPITLEQYYDIMYEQAYASKQGKDAVQALKAMGLSIVVWTDLGSYMGYFFHRTAQLHWKEYEAVHVAVKAKFEAKYPGVKPDVDIQF